MFSPVFTRKPKAAVVDQEKCRLLLPNFRRIVVPAMGAPFSERAVRLACRMAGNGDAEMRLVYFMEVPRAYSLSASLPGEEALANNVLDDGFHLADSLGCITGTEVQRGRDVTETILRYTIQHEVSLLIIGSRPDGLRGLPLALARELNDRAPCPVLLDYIAGEVSYDSQEQPFASS